MPDDQVADDRPMTHAEVAELLTAGVALATACTAFVAAVEHLYPMLDRSLIRRRAAKLDEQPPPPTIRDSRC